MGSAVLRSATPADIDGLLAFDMTVVVRTREGDGAPAGWYLTGVTVLPQHRRMGLGRDLTIARLEWIAERTDAAWYFANAQNTASIDLHRRLGFGNRGTVNAGRSVPDRLDR